MKTTACKQCGERIEFEPLLFHGKEVGTPGYCDPCLERIEVAEAEGEQETHRHERVARSGMPLEQQGFPLPPTSLGHLATLWAKGELEKPGLCLTGPEGVGKTYLAAAACWERLQEAACLWMPIAQLFVQLRGGFGAKRDAAVQALLSPTALVLEDLDKGNPTEYAKEVIFAAIDKRVEVGAPLLVTTNLGLDEVKDRYGGPVASRLAGHCEVIHMTGRDRRLAA